MSTPWRFSNFTKQFDYFEINIHFLFALYAFQKNNYLTLLAKATKTKLINFQLQLSTYYYNELQLLINYKEKYLKRFYRSKKVRTHNLHYYHHAKKCPKHRPKVFKKWSDYRIEEFIINKNRFYQEKISEHRNAFETVNSCWKKAKKFETRLIALNVFPSLP